MKLIKKKFPELYIYSSLLLLVCCDVGLVQSATEQDLIEAYQKEKQVISTFLNQLADIPDSVKSAWVSGLNDAEAKIDSLYNIAEGSIKPLLPKLNSTNLIDKLNASEQISSLSDTAQSAIEKVINSLDLTIGVQVTNYLNSEQAQRDRDALKKAKEEQKKLEQAQEEYQKKIVAELEAAKKITAAFDTVVDTMQRYVLNTYQKPYDATKLVPVIEDWQSVLSLAYNLYSALGPIDVNDQNNLLIISFKTVSNFLLDQVYNQVKDIQGKKLDENAYKIIYLVNQMLLGTHKSSDNFLARDGFDAFINNEIKKCFKDTNQQATLYNYYLQKKNNITYNFFKNTLLTFVNGLSDPSEQQRLYALAMYQVLMSEFAVVDQSNAVVKQAMQAVDNSMAILYVTSALALQKKFQLKDDTAKVLPSLIDFYNQAADYFKKAGNTGQSQTYQGYAQNLSDALKALNKAATATKSGDIGTTLSLYKQAQDLFKRGGDLLDVSKISIILVDLEAKYALGAVKKLISQFEVDNKTLLQNYNEYCNNLESSLTLNQCEPLLTNLVDLYKKVTALYTAASDAYNAAVDNNLPLKLTQDTQALTTNFKSIQDLLGMLQQAYDLMQKGDSLLPLQTVADLNEAETSYYQPAVTLFKEIDQLYTDNSELLLFVPSVFVSLDAQGSLNYETRAHRHIAKFCIEIAKQITQADSALAYYTNANAGKDFLPKEIQDFLTSKIEELTKSKDAVEKLFAQAQDTQKKLLILKANDWAATSSDGVYRSSASDQWNQLLQHYISLYHLGKLEAKASYITAVQQYAENFEKYGPDNYQVMSALIYYQLYILHTNDNEAQDAATVLQEIEKRLNASVDFVQKLLGSVANMSSLLTTATNDQEKVIEWVNQAEYAVAQQKEILTMVGTSLSSEQQAAVSFIEKHVNADKIQYSLLLIKKMVEVVNPMITMADLYKKIGDVNFKKKNYNAAYPAYAQARQRYADAGKSLNDELTHQIALSYTLYLASQYSGLVIPQGQNTLANMQVPDSYELQVFGQTVPEDLSEQFPNLDFLKNDEQKTRTFLIDLAASIYLYNKLNELFGSNSWATYSPLFALNFDALKTNPVFTELSQEKKNAFVSMVGFAGKMKDDLTQRASKKLTNFVLQQKPNKQFILYIYYIPLPRFADTQNYYQGYPAAIVYFSWAALLFQPGPSTGMISVGQTSLPHGNDPEAYQASVMDQVKTYLSEGYSYQKKLQALQETKPWKDLLSISKTDMSKTVDTYADLQAALNDDFNQMILYYKGPQAGNLIGQKDPSEQSLHDLIEKTYKNWADALVPFLIGDPLASSYIGVLKDILQKYVVVITTYGVDSSLYLEMSKKYNDAGQLLVNQEKYFDSISYFYTAASKAKDVTPQTSTTQKAIDQFYINYLDALVRGSTLKMGQFHTAITQPISISNGQEKIAFNDLLIKYLKNEVSSEEATAMDDIKNLVLDALIFYNVCNSYISQGIESTNDESILKWVGIDDQSLSKVHQQASELITSFTDKNGVSLESIDGITAMLSHVNFPDGKDFVEMFLKGFTQFEGKVKDSQDSFNRAVGYSAIAQLSLKLYEAFSKVFITTYYGAVSTDSYASLSAAIQARTNDILSSSKLYIG